MPNRDEARNATFQRLYGSDNSYALDPIGKLNGVVDDVLHGVQLPLQGRQPRAYRVSNRLGACLVLCDACLDLRRAAGEAWALTGEDFVVTFCDDCNSTEAL